jgi:hypothetical protein
MTHVKQTRKRSDSNRSSRNSNGGRLRAKSFSGVNWYVLTPWLACLVFWIVIGVLCFIF